MLFKCERHPTKTPRSDKQTIQLKSVKFFMWLKGVSKYVVKGFVENIIGSRIKTLCRFKTNMMKDGDHNQYINSVREAGKRRKIIVERSFEVAVCYEIAAVSPPPPPPRLSHSATQTPQFKFHASEELDPPHHLYPFIFSANKILQYLCLFLCVPYPYYLLYTTRLAILKGKILNLHQ
jgi:hypothetical protein